MTSDRTSPDWMELLHATVYRNEAFLREEDREDGSREIEVALKPKWYMQRPFSLVFPFRNSKRILLDPVGVCILNKCSQPVRVEAIVDWFAAEESLTFHESRLMVSSYLRILMQEGLIAMGNTPETGRQVTGNDD